MYYRQQKCIICQKESTSGIRIKHGLLCRECSSDLPESVQKAPENLTVNALKELISCNRVGKKMACGLIFTCGGVKVFRNAYAFHEFYVPAERVKKLTVMPERHESHRAIVRIILKNPELFFDFITDELTPDRKPEEYMGSFLKYASTKMEYTPVSSIQNNQPLPNREKNRIYTSGYKYGYDAGYKDGYRTGGQQGFNDGYQKGTRVKDPYHDARVLFMLPDAYTEEQLKKRYKKLQKAFHPDSGETDMVPAQKINAAYAVLKKYCKK